MDLISRWGKIVLASGSPRRKELLRQAVPEFVIITADVPETVPEGTPPHLACMFNAFRKASAVAGQLEAGLVIGADTIVYDRRILGKPADEQDAAETLRALRNRAHQVMTGVSLISADGTVRRVFYDVTEVTFGEYSDEEIAAYVRSGEPMDKAGSYAIQGSWRSHVTAVEGSLSNVIGLPMEMLVKELAGLTG
ncbi:MAG: septum formation protein Maf [Firmicutes bacterium]|nr:septum formation protein Maf [Bacillota bacterium]